MGSFERLILAKQDFLYMVLGQPWQRENPSKTPLISALGSPLQENERILFSNNKGF